MTVGSVKEVIMAKPCRCVLPSPFLQKEWVGRLENICSSSSPLVVDDVCDWLCDEESQNFPTENHHNGTQAQKTSTNETSGDKFITDLPLLLVTKFGDPCCCVHHPVR